MTVVVDGGGDAGRLITVEIEVMMAVIVVVKAEGLFWRKF